jgi:hypothetical protein
MGHPSFARNQAERAVESHISRKTSEIWATRPSLGNQAGSLETLLLALAEAAKIFGYCFFVARRHRRLFCGAHLTRLIV